MSRNEPQNDSPPLRSSGWADDDPTGQVLPTEAELAEAREWRHANFPGIKDEPPDAEGIGQQFDSHEIEVLQGAVAQALADYLVKAREDQPWRADYFNTLVRIGNKLGMNL